MDFQIFGCFEKLMTYTLQKTQREAKIDGQITSRERPRQGRVVSQSCVETMA